MSDVKRRCEVGPLTLNPNEAFIALLVIASKCNLPFYLLLSPFFVMWGRGGEDGKTVSLTYSVFKVLLKHLKRLLMISKL